MSEKLNEQLDKIHAKLLSFKQEEKEIICKRDSVKKELESIFIDSICSKNILNGTKWEFDRHYPYNLYLADYHDCKDIFGPSYGKVLKELYTLYTTIQLDENVSMNIGHPTPTLKYKGSVKEVIAKYGITIDNSLLKENMKEIQREIAELQEELSILQEASLI